MYSLLYYFLISLSLTHLRCSSLLTKAKTPVQGYTFDLIHRYSPISPLYNSSMTRRQRYQRLAEHSASRRRHFKLIENNNGFQSNLIPSQGDYLVKISLGEPPVDLYVIADTSTDLMWVQCTPCDHCNQQRVMFDPTQSSTFNTISCDSQYCPHTPSMDCDDFTNECQYRYVFGNGTSSTTGIMARDMLTFGASGVSATYIFGCAQDLDDDFDKNAAGFLGLSGGPFSLISQLGMSGRFSYCLTPSDSNTASALRLGGDAMTGPGAATTPLLTRYLPTVYAIRLLGISIGQMRLEIEREIFIDSSSMLTYIDPSAYSRLEDAVQQAIGAVQPMPKPPLSDLSLCYDRNSEFLAQATIEFHFDGGEISLSSTNLFVDLGDVVCLAIVPSVEDGDPMVLGNVAQVNFEVEFDLRSNVMSFTPTNCALGSTRH